MFPLLQRRLDQVKDGQRCMGRDDGIRHPVRKIRIFSKELSILIAWSLEAGIETSDSMEARGYGLKGRSSYTIYRFGRRDLCVLLLILLLGGRQCRVIFESNGGTQVPTILVKRGDSLETLPIPTRSRSVFGGWYKDAALTKPWYAGMDKVTKKKTKLYAKWR